MKITKELLKQIIKEEILKERKLREGFAFKAEDTPQDETPPLRHSGQKRAFRLGDDWGSSRDRSRNRLLF